MKCAQLTVFVAALWAGISSAQVSDAAGNDYRAGNGTEAPAANSKAVPASEEAQSVIEEIIVTAQRRGPERLQDIPMSVSVIDEETIRRAGLVGMDDYLRALPSISYVEYSPGMNNVIIRGIATDFFRSETTGIYVGNTPVTNLGVRGQGDPDLKLVDIERIEVLRGPQGTLYGEGSMGGTVRIIPAAPNAERFESQVTGSFSVTGAEGGNNSTIEGMLNMPLLDGDAAFRLVAYRHDNSGYYRDITGSDPDARYWSEYFGVPAIDKSDVGETTFTGWRAQLLWQPMPDLSITLLILSQDIDQNGMPEGVVGLERFQRTSLRKLNGDGDTSVSDFDLSSLEVNFDFRAFSLFSTTSLVDGWAGYDRSLPWLAADFGYGDIPVFHRWGGPARSFSQELRLTSQQDGRLRYLTGYFYQDVESSIDNIYSFEGDPALDPYEGATILDALGDFDETQTSLFGELTYDLTDRLTGSVGARGFRYDQSELWTGGGLWAGADSTEVLTSGEGDGQNYSLKLEYQASESTRIYGSFNQGFRFGGPHDKVPPPGCDEDGDGVIDGSGIPWPTKIDSDTVDSYELGVRYKSSGGRVAINATIFSVDWTDIPIRVFVPCGVGNSTGVWLTLNAGKAESQGIELEGAWEIAKGLVFNYAASWVDPRLTEDAESLGQAGDRLPGSPRHNLNLGVQHEFTIGGYDAFVRADLVDVGEYYDNLQQMGQASGGYTTIGARAGVSLNDWLIDLYADNLTDEFALTYYDSWFGLYYVLRPRTVGVQVSYQPSDW
jgi:outer membrane receptor protein involved in Fe transport